MEEQTKGVCVTCGYLALRNRITGNLDEAPKSYRGTGQPPSLISPTSKVTPYSGFPTCFQMAASLEEEVADVTEEFKRQVLNNNEVIDWHLANVEGLTERDDRGEGHEKVHRVISKPHRNCQLWVRWRQGSTPKEHREMMDRQRMQGEQKKQNWINLGIAFLAVVVAAIGIYLSATYNLRAARIQAEAQKQAAQMTIDFQRTFLATATPTPLPTPAPQSTPGSNTPSPSATP